MRQIRLILGTNNSLPPGTPDYQFEEAYQNAYRPFLTQIYKFPEIQVTLHYSGILLQWIEDKHPEFLMLLNDMVKRNQVELLSGAYYDAVLPIIPNVDRVGQIEMLTTYLRKKFGKRPRGIWLAERVWEPGMPSSLKKCGMEYIFLDDMHFKGAGLRGGELLYPCLTEDQGNALTVFPVSDSIYLSPFDWQPGKLVEQIQDHADENGSRVLSVIEDGEGLGLWGDSTELLYDREWLGEFLSHLTHRRDVIKTLLPSAFTLSDEAIHKHYFQCSSYEDMMSWPLSFKRGEELDRFKNSRISKQNKAFITGGYFRQFLTKYPESNLMYSKMMHVQIMVNQIRNDKSRKKAAREELWKGESHSAYWHGKTGGIHLNHVRKAVYSALILAEKTARQNGVFKNHISIEDFDMDGREEYLCQGSEINAYFHRQGGVLFELDFLPKSWNYLDIFSRHRELYQNKLDNSHAFDWYQRRAFVDHFFHRTDDIGTFSAMTYRELGDFVLKPYEVKDCRRDHLNLVFAAKGTVENDGVISPVHIEKKCELTKNCVSVLYTITNLDTKKLQVIFGSEVNLSFASPEQDSLSLSVTKNESQVTVYDPVSSQKNIREFRALDIANGVEIKMEMDVAGTLWILPLETSWYSNEGQQSGYQNTCFVPHWNVSIEPGVKWQVALRLTLANAKKRSKAAQRSL